MAHPKWYIPDESDGDMILGARVVLPKPYGTVVLVDANERSRRKVQNAARAVLSGINVADAQSGRISADAVDLDKLAVLSRAKLEAYVHAIEDPTGTISGPVADWDGLLDTVPARVVDRIVSGIDIFTAATNEVSAEGNVGTTSSQRRLDTSCSETTSQLTGPCSGLSSTSSTQAEPGSSPPVEVSPISPAP